nr:retrovirus-related Pol polyprotein from transposon TNT 1-94 [Tanacetum cinerariifolium]
MAGGDENATNPPPVPPTPQAPHTLSTIKLPIIKKGELQSLLSQLEIYGASVSTEYANQKFLRVFESDVKGSTVLSSSTQNVAFVSSDSINSTNEVDEFDLEEMYLKWKVAMISTRLKKFYKKTERKLHFDAKEPVGFDKTKVECFNCHNIRHFARECRLKGNQESRRRDAGNTRYKARDNRRRPVKQDEHKAMVTIDGEGVDWTSHAEDDIENYDLMAFNSSNSGSDTEVTSCLKVCEESYAKLKKLYDEHREQLGALSYENEVLESVFDSRSSDVEDSHVNDRFAKVEGMHAVPPPMTGIYMPLKYDFGIDESKFTYVPKPVESKPKAVNEPKVWSDAPIIEEYESDSDDEYVFKASVEQEKPSCAFINTIKHVKTPRQTVKDQDTCSQNPKVPKREWTGLMFKILGLGYGYTRKACFTLKGKVIVDSGCLRHMTKNKAYLVEHQDFNGGPIAFGGSKGQITVLLRVPKQNNMYSFNLENIVPSGGLACLIAKATIDESNKWHRRVLVTKPQNKTPYELITGKIPIISYVRPFGCHVTILNTIDHLGKFKEKSNEGFLVEYSLNSKAFRVYNFETKRVEENLHINFLANKPNVARKGPTWLFDLDITNSINCQPVTGKNKSSKIAGPKEANNSAGTQDNIDVGNSDMEAEHVQEYFVLPLWSSYTSIVKSSEAKNGDENLNEDTDADGEVEVLEPTGVLEMRHEKLGNGTLSSMEEPNSRRCNMGSLGRFD